MKTTKKKSDARTQAKAAAQPAKTNKRGKALGDEELSRVAGGDIMIEQLTAHGIGKGAQK